MSVLRFPRPRAIVDAHARREAAIESVDALAQSIAPGRVYEADGLAWRVAALEQLGCVVLIATVASDRAEVLRVRVEVPRAGRRLDDPDLADELARDLRIETALAADDVTDIADRIRAARNP